MFDVVVIGSGPGGYVSAIRASQLGLKTAIIELDKLGGICLNWGCIPTKVLLKVSDKVRAVKHAKSFGILGINEEDVRVDIDLVVKRSRDVADTLSSGIISLMKKNKIDVIRGRAKIVSENEIFVDGKSITAKYIVVATGGRARVLPNYEPDGNRVWTYKEALMPKFLPKSLIIIGGGAIGIEFASFYNEIGVSVTLIEACDRILINEDQEISNIVKKDLEKQGIEILTKAVLGKLHKDTNGVILECTINGIKGSTSADAMIVATGIVPNTENIGLEDVGVDLDVLTSRIKINEYCLTNIKNIYAIGDVTNSVPFLAHKASYEGIIAAEHIATNFGSYDIRKIHILNCSNIPSCVYSYPQVASIGYTEEEAIKRGIEYRVGRFPFFANGKSVASGETSGLIKTIFDKNTGELLGAHMVGADVTELIGTFSIAKHSELIELDFIGTIFPHPTVSESIHESILSAFGIGLHI